MKKQLTFGPWLLEYTLDDGARIDRLAYAGYDFMTTAPKTFRRPQGDFGAYELRPVYGYDDCFPSVERCRYPGLSWDVPDHGEVCWLPWEEQRFADGVTFSVHSKVVPLQLHRRLTFSDAEVIWDFEVFNEGNEALPFQHVMHPLMPLSEITALRMPAAQTVMERSSQKTLPLHGPAELETILMHQAEGTATMLFLIGIAEGSMSWTYKNGITITASFPSDLFPSIGIWWNRTGYPNEPGIRRDECAFEPVPGHSSALSEAHQAGLCLTAAPQRRTSWQIRWKITK